MVARSRRPLAGTVRGLRVGIPREPFLARASEEVEGLVRAAIRTLEGLGATIVEGSLPRVDLAPTAGMTIISVEAAKAPDAHVAGRGLGRILLAPLGVILRDRPADTTVLQPDIIFLGRDRLGSIRHRAIEGPPTLAVEVLSPSTAVADRTLKRDLYARYGVPHFWLVDLDARDISGHVLRAGAYALATRVSGAEPVDLPPFVDLDLVPPSLWS